jgi:hypothetical protein
MIFDINVSKPVAGHGIGADSRLSVRSEPHFKSEIICCLFYRHQSMSANANLSPDPSTGFLKTFFAGGATTTSIKYLRIYCICLHIKRLKLTKLFPHSVVCLDETLVDGFEHGLVLVQPESLLSHYKVHQMVLRYQSHT